MRISAVVGRGFLLLAVTAAASGCSSGGGPDGGTGCTVTGVAVAANPNSINTADTSTLTATLSTTGSCSGGVTWSATPTGGTLTPSGTTATFGSTTPGSYTITATSTVDTSKSGSANVNVTAAVTCGSANGTVVTHSANITASETWAGDGVTHSVPNSINIASQATVTVEACALVNLGQGASITVAGGATLLSVGTSDTRFVTFQPANSGQPWGILRGSTSTSDNTSALIELHWTQLLSGGAFGGEYHNPAIAVAGLGYSSPPTPMLRVDNVIIDSPQGVGVYFDGNAAFTSDSQNLIIQNTPDYVLEMTLMSVGSIPTGTYNNTNNALPYAIVDVGGASRIFADMTIHNRLPVIIPYSEVTVSPPSGTTTPVTLTLDPGVQLYFNGTRVIFGGNGNDPNNAVGVLVAQGTASEPILFSSAAASPAPGDWVGLWLDTATGSQLDYVVIEYAGAASGIVSANCKPLSTSDNAGLIVGDFSTQYIPPSDLITNSVIQYSAGYGIDAVWQNSTNDSPDLASNNNLFQNNAGCAQTYNALSAGVCATNGCTAP
jgi:hypothetical protein